MKTVAVLLARLRCFVRGHRWIRPYAMDSTFRDHAVCTSCGSEYIAPWRAIAPPCGPEGGTLYSVSKRELARIEKAPRTLG